MNMNYNEHWIWIIAFFMECFRYVTRTFLNYTYRQLKGGIKNLGNWCFVSTCT